MAIGRNLCPEAFAILVLMNRFCRKHEACPGDMIAAVRIGDHNLQYLPALLRCEGFHRSFPKMQGNLFDLFIGSVLLAHLFIPPHHRSLQLHLLQIPPGYRFRHRPHDNPHPDPDILQIQTGSFCSSGRRTLNPNRMHQSEGSAQLHKAARYIHRLL